MVNINDINDLLFNIDGTIYLVEVSEDKRVSFTNMKDGKDESSLELLASVLEIIKKDYVNLIQK